MGQRFTLRVLTGPPTGALILAINCIPLHYNHDLNWINIITKAMYGRVQMETIIISTLRLGISQKKTDDFYFAKITPDRLPRSLGGAGT